MSSSQLCGGGMAPQVGGRPAQLLARQDGKHAVAGRRMGARRAAGPPAPAACASAASHYHCSPMSDSRCKTWPLPTCSADRLCQHGLRHTEQADWRVPRHVPHVLRCRWVPLLPCHLGMVRNGGVCACAAIYRHRLPASPASPFSLVEQRGGELGMRFVSMMLAHLKAASKQACPGTFPAVIA